jgi:hypothetical protein
MVISALDFSDIMSRETLDNGRVVNESIAFTSATGNSCLAVVVKTPRIDLAILVNSKAVERAAGNIGNLALGKTKLRRYQAVGASSLNDATTKLILLTTAPSEDVTLGVKSLNMIATRGKSFDVFQLGNESRACLELLFLGDGVLRKTNNTIVALLYVNQNS